MSDLPPIPGRASPESLPDLPPIQRGAAAPTQPTVDYEDMPWSEVGQHALENAPGSAKKALTGVWDAVTHPVETGQALWDIPKGLGSKAARFIHDTTGLGNMRRTPEEIAADERVVDAIGGDYSDRYGSMAGFKKGLSEDPFAYGMDVASVAPVVGAGAKAVGVTGTVGKALGVASKASEFVDPVQLAMKAASVPGTIGKMVNVGASGVGNTAFDLAQDVGRYGDKADRSAFSAGKVGAGIDDVPEKAMAALEELRNNASAAYQSTKGGLSNVMLDKGPIVDAINSVREQIGGVHHGPLLHPQLWKALNSMEKKVFHARDTTPGGLDNLKRSFNDTIGTEIPPQWSGAFAKVTDAIKDTINAADPTYGKMLEDWGTWRAELNDIKKTLAMGDKASATARLNKLMKSLSDDKKMRLIDKLDATKAGRGLKAFIAGNSFRNWLPARTPALADLAVGAGTSMMFGLPAHIALPAAVAPLALGSPRLYGNLAYATGMTQRGVDAVRPGLGLADNVLSQIGQQEEEDRAPRKSGGRVGSKASIGADRLIRAAEKARKQLGTSTEPLLNTPDHTVASALEIANRSI